MKKSVNAWTIDAETSFEMMFKEIKEAGFDGIELNIDNENFSKHSITLSTSDEELAQIKAISDKYELPIVSISSSLYGITIGSREPEDNQKAIEIIKKQVHCAKTFGATGVLIVPGGISDDMSIKEAYENSIKTLCQVKDFALEQKVYIGVENVWNGFFTSPFAMRDFIEEIDCEYIGAYFDVGNVIAFSWPEYWIDILGSHIHNIHIKDFKRTNGRINQGGQWVDLLQGDVNWSKVIPALKAAGFDGYLTAEVFKNDAVDPTISYQDYYSAVSKQIKTIIEGN